ncbi:2-phospho-L-lactate guanylyltransferase [Vibrio sp.]|nr:2-phospho-L-lactate guanylyltransferase [Vibrio sp.]
MKDHSINIVIPMKGLSYSKQRLQHVLTTSQRETLSLTLFQTTVRFFRDEYPEHNVLVVTECSSIANLARKMAADILYIPNNKGLNTALQAATRWSKKHNFIYQLIIPADISKLDKTELDIVIKSGYQHSVTMVTAKDLGTNALMSSPPDAIPFKFGQQSSIHHAHQAHKSGLSLDIMTMKSLSQDIDNERDLLHWYEPLRGEFIYE